jgi:tRNA threonylcarbamoyladenosine biosynthesis protein TsaE
MHRERTQSAAQTEALGERLGRQCRGGEVFLLHGELGAGKTTLVRGLARGLGIEEQEIASPTFVLLTSHPGRLCLHHADLYRIDAADVEMELTLSELPGPAGVLVVEWAERLSRVPWDRWRRIDLAHAGDDARIIAVDEDGAMHPEEEEQ